MDKIDFLRASRELKQGLKKLVRVTENPRSAEAITADEHIMLYTIVYDLCTVKGANKEMEELMYNSFEETVQEYLSRTVQANRIMRTWLLQEIFTTQSPPFQVLPPLMQMQGDELAEQFVTKWGVYKNVYEKISHIFYYLLRSFTNRKTHDAAKHRSQLFCERVFRETHEQVAEAAIAMITRFREGQEINEILLKQILAVIVELGNGTLKYYDQYFEDIFLERTQEYYIQKATNWGYVDTSDRYTVKVAHSLATEEDIGSLFLSESTGPKLRLTVQNAFQAASENVMDQLFKKGLRLERASGSEGDN